MLIYNSKKEFVGIEESDLSTLGFSNLSQLKTEVSDFADMFVKTPGYIHNFKHVNWIDFLLCSDSTERPKVIIHANDKNFKCTLDVKTAYLSDKPSSKAFLVYLNNIKELTSSEDEDISADIASRPSPILPTETTETFETEVIEETTEEVATAEEGAVQEPFLEITEESYEEQIDETLPDLDLPLDLEFHDEIEEEPAVTPQAEEEPLEEALTFDVEEPEVQEREVEYNEEVFDNGYIYNPQIASDELGLPVDLIEEFIEDFIAQAKEFKDDLYTSLDEGNDENVKILSHKLKGVAANLRIEDAFEVLTIINTSDDNNEVKTNLDTLYKIISKLSGEKTLVTKNKIIEEPEQDDEIAIDFKEDQPEIKIDEPFEETIEEVDELDIFTPSDEVEKFEEPKESIEDNDQIELEFKPDASKSIEPISDNEVPQKIDIPELIDDEFLNQKDEEEIEIDDSLNLETISDEETQSLENESIDVDDIELLEGYGIEDDEIIDIECLDIESPGVEPAKHIEYDRTSVANEIGIPHDLFLELFDDYVAEAQEISSSIINAIETKNSKLWKNKAIQLKGMSDNMRIHEFTKELEILIRTQDTIVARDAIDTIAEYITEISKLKG